MHINTIGKWAASSILFFVGCGEPGGEGISVPLYLAGTEIDNPVIGIGGVKVDIDRADVAFGPLYLCAGEWGGILCESRLEYLESAVVNVISHDPISVGELDGYSGHVRSWMFDLGAVSLPTQPEHLLLTAAKELEDASVRVSGQAIVENTTIPFSVALVIASGQPDAGLPVIRKSGGDEFGHDVSSEEIGLLIRFDARPWVAHIDFMTLLEDQDCASKDAPIVCSGQIENLCENGDLVSSRSCKAVNQVCIRDLGCVDSVDFGPESQGYRSIRNQVVAGPRPKFEWL